MAKSTINFKEWSKESPGEAVLNAALQSEEVQEEFYNVLSDYVASPEEFVYNEWIAIHALRFLFDKRDFRVVPLAANIIEKEGKDWESIIVDNAQMVLDELSTIEAQPILLDLYEQSKKVADEDYRLDILRALFHSGYRSLETDAKMIEAFQLEPDQIAFDFSESKELKWIPILEQKLRELAPFIKFVPNRKNFDSLTMHWRETAGAWFALKCIETGNFEFVRPTREFKFYKEFTPPAETEKNALTELFTREAKERDQLAQAKFLDVLPKSFAEFRNLPGMNQLLIRNIHLAIQDALLELGDSSEKIGRNDPCPCGSGKKYKKCCL